MKRMLTGVAALLLVGLAGCDKGLDPRDSMAGLFGGKKDIKTETTILEIDAVGNLKSDSAKREGFVILSKRDNLSGEEQVYLVRTAVKELYLDEDKEQVIRNIIDSERFSCAAKKEILLLLGKLKTDETRLWIIQKLNDTDTCIDPSAVAAPDKP